MSEQTIKTYTTKGFSNVGVTNAEKVSRIVENGASGITPDVMKNSAGGITTITKDTVKIPGVGNGVDSDKPVDKYKAQKSGAAGMVGANNINKA